MADDPGRAVDEETVADNGAFGSVGSGAPRSPTPATATAGTVDLGPMCPADFKISEGAAAACGAIRDFATPPLLPELFRKMPLRDMLRSVEVNAVKVCLCPVICFIVLFVLC